MPRQADRPFFEGAGRAAIMGAIGGLVAPAIGKFVGSTGYYGKEIFRAALHGYSGAMMNAIQGGNPLEGMASGAFSSAVSSGVSGLKLGRGVTIVSGEITGGIGSVIAGGDFFKGAAMGFAVSGLNHAMHGVDGEEEKYPKRD